MNLFTAPATQLDSALPFDNGAWRLSAVLIISVALALGLQADEVAENSKQPAEFAPAALEFFEKKIRPALVEHCYKCHSSQAEKLQGGFFIDSRQGILEGGDSGPAVVVGKPGESLLIEALRHESFEMPPDKRLPNELIADFEQWIRAGLADPRVRAEGAATKPRVLYSQKDAETHWAFQPLSNPAVPAIDDRWIRTPIDAFILDKLRAAGLEPSPRADRPALLRRMSYGLTGLPPSFSDVKAFESATSADATAAAIDRLLQSPRYGEKWARHWLDVARYADTNGQRPAPTPDAPFYPFAWIYRDYVVDALNRDLPFDQFIVEQLAGDSLATETDRRPLAGLGFLRVGKTFGQNIDDRIDDRIDTISKAFLGLTVSCARCHDHKLDPIYQDDYYALHGVLASCEDYDAVYRDTSGTDAYEDYQRQAELLNSEIEAECLDRLNQFMHGLTLQVADHMVAAEAFRDGKLTEKNPALAAREVGLQPIPFQAWLKNMARWEKQNVAAYRPWFAFAALSESDFAEESPAIAAAVASGTLNGQPVPQLLARRFKDRKLTSLKDVAEIYQSLFLEIEKLAGGRYPMAALLCAMQESPGLFRKEYYDHPSLPGPLADRELESLRRATIGFEGPFFMTPREMMQSGAADARKAMVRRKHELTELESRHPGAPLRAMGVRDLKRPVDSPIFIRGDSKLPGEVVRRRFLRRLCEGDPQPFTAGSGRVELARAIASPDNPLTPRVIVNRVWQWHFGRGLVATPSDFGLNGEPPSHAELLDWLTRRFIEEGWSLKELHRLIMNSSVYQQRSLPRADGLETDSENRLLWRMNPRRLTFEELRDSWLAAAGTLKHEIGGRPVDPLADSTRRSIYVYVDRYKLPAVFDTFDFAPPDFSTADRDTTIVPQQALYMMNSQWLIDRSHDLASRAEVAKAGDLAKQVVALYRIVYQREPDADELSRVLRFLNAFPKDKASIARQRLAHALLQTNEAIHVP